MKALHKGIYAAVFFSAIISVSFLINAESNVKQLTDANFEHDTQASTGATTGPWFVKFYATWCGHCKNMAPAWEKLATQLKGKVNIAEIEAANNSVTSKRFKIRGFPSLILLNQGKMYAYDGERTVEKMKAFAEGGYKSVKASDIPSPLSTFDVMKDELYNAILQLHGIVIHAPLPFCILFFVGILCGIFLSCLFYCCCSRSASQSDASKRAKMKKKD